MKKMKKIASIRHNDGDSAGRVALYQGPDGYVWAAAEAEAVYRTDVLLAGISLAWSGPAWDLQWECLAQEEI